MFNSSRIHQKVPANFYNRFIANLEISSIVMNSREHDKICREFVTNSLEMSKTLSVSITLSILLSFITKHKKKNEDSSLA